MARFRIKKQTVWRTHSVLGLIAGLGLLVIGLTGSVLMFSKEIDGALHPEVVRVQPPEGNERLAMDELVARMASAFPGHRLMGWVPGEDAHSSDRVWLKLPGDEHWLAAAIDPYTGKILSRPAESGSTFTGWILELHYTLLADHVGLALVGIFALCLFLLGLSGLWLYRDFFRNFFRLRWRSSTRILFSDLHKFVGINSVVFNLILGFTGAWWNLTHVIGHLVEEEAPAGSAEVAEVGPPPSEWASLDSMLGDASARIDGFEANYIGLPNAPENAFFLYGRHGGAGVLRSPHGSMVSYESTGDFREATDVREASLWAQFLDTFVPLHFGTFGGWPIRILWSLGGLAPGTLAVTGFVLWFRRRRGSKKTTALPRSTAATSATAAVSPAPDRAPDPAALP